MEAGCVGGVGGTLTAKVYVGTRGKQRGERKRGAMWQTVASEDEEPLGHTVVPAKGGTPTGMAQARLEMCVVRCVCVCVCVVDRSELRIVAVWLADDS